MTGEPRCGVPPRGGTPRVPLGPGPRGCCRTRRTRRAVRLRYVACGPCAVRRAPPWSATRSTGTAQVSTTVSSAYSVTSCSSSVMAGTDRDASRLASVIGSRSTRTSSWRTATVCRCSSATTYLRRRARPDSWRSTPTCISSSERVIASSAHVGLTGRRGHRAHRGGGPRIGSGRVGGRPASLIGPVRVLPRRVPVDAGAVAVAVPASAGRRARRGRRVGGEEFGGAGEPEQVREAVARVQGERGSGVGGAVAGVEQGVQAR